MNIHHHQLPILLATGLAAGTLLAIEAPPDTAPPPAENIAPAAEAAGDNAAVVNETAYLGIVSSGVPEMLAAHLGLQAGEGVIVSAVMPDGPAAKAGLAINDVITRIGGNPAGSPEDLTREVSARKPGDKLNIELIHQGKPASIDVTLGLRPEHIDAPQVRAPGRLDQLDRFNQLNLDGVPRELADRVRRMIEGNLGDVQLDLEQGLQNAAPQFEDAMREMKERMEKAMQGLQIPDVPVIPQERGIQIQRGATLRLMDGEGSVELKSNHGGKEVTVRDTEQKIVWSGPWDTDQDKAAAPEDIRERVEKLNLDANGNGLRLRFNQGIDEP